MIKTVHRTSSTDYGPLFPMSLLSDIFDYTVQTYDIDKHKRMTPTALVKQMQEAAMQNVIRMNISVWDLEKDHISWVLQRKNLNIKRLPFLGEKLKFYTCPTGFEKIFTYRDYKVFDEKGELIAFSSSRWLLLDTQSRRMTRIPPFIMEFEKDMPSLSDCLPRPATKIPSIDKPILEKNFRVDWHSLDFNGHLNNVYYLQWMVDTLPDQILESSQLLSFDIQYKVEGHWKEEIKSESQVVDENTFLHRLSRVLDGKELALGKSQWG